MISLAVSLLDQIMGNLFFVVKATTHDKHVNRGQRCRTNENRNINEVYHDLSRVRAGFITDSGTTMKLKLL